MRLEIPKEVLNAAVIDALKAQQPAAVENGLVSGFPLFGGDANHQSVSTNVYADTVPGAFDVEMNAYREWLGWFESANGCQRGETDNPVKKIIIANDIHAPFQHDEAILAMVKEESKDTDLLIIAGDLMDLWSVSRWAKSRKITDPITEFKESTKVLAMLSENFPEVHVLGGNHDARFRKMVADVLPVDVLEYFDFLSPHALNPLAKICSEFPNVKMCPTIKSDFAEFAFLYQIGDCVISHAETYSKLSAKATSNLIQWLMSFAVPEGIIKPGFRVACQAHTHQAATAFDNFGVMGIEMGCLCRTQEYQATPKILGVRPSKQGWTRIFQDENGRTDRRQSRFIPFE